MGTICSALAAPGRAGPFEIGSGQTQLTILNVAYSLAAVAPDAGGAEQVLGMLDRALTDAGHRSVVIAAEGSNVAGTLVPVPAREGANSYADWVAAHDAHRAALARALAEFPVDLLHFHGHDFLDYLPPTNLPTLVTLHLPPRWYRPEVFGLRRPGLELHCVSRSQRLACPPEARLGPEIENGIRVEAFAVPAPKSTYAVAMGRICPEKGFHLALDAAHRAGVDLRLAGRVHAYAGHQRYFEEVVVPRLDDRRRFLGPVGLERKARLLAGARCLLVSSVAPETSSLVAMEALAAGTPVVAFGVGALPEIVEDGVTGFLVQDVPQMAAAIGRADALDPEACRRAARERFSADRMVAGYLERYRRLAARG